MKSILLALKQCLLNDHSVIEDTLGKWAIGYQAATRQDITNQRGEGIWERLADKNL